MEINFCKDSFYKCHRVTMNNYNFTKGLVYKCIDSDKLLATLEDERGYRYYTPQYAIEYFNKSGINPKNWYINNEKVRNTPLEDRVNHPSHYSYLKDLCGIEVIDITRHLNFNIGNAIKYLLRKDKKDIISSKEKRIEDLKKAVFYINDEILRLDGNTD